MNKFDAMKIKKTKRTKYPKVMTAYIAGVDNEEINAVAVYGWDPLKNEAYIIEITGKIKRILSTKGTGNNQIGPCGLVDVLSDYNVPEKHLLAVKNERPF